MNKVYYDNVIFSLQKSGGISRYWFELTSRLLKKQNIGFIEGTGKQQENIFRVLLEINPSLVKEKNRGYLSRYFPIRNIWGEKYIFHSSYYRYATGQNAINITTVYDFTYEKYRKGLSKSIHCFQKKKCLKQSSAIICISENTKKDLLSIYPCVDVDKISVIYCGVGDEFYSKNTVETKDHILFVGARGHYKNFDIAIKSVSMIPDLRLVFVGGGNITSNEQFLLDKYLENRYEHILDVDNHQLNALYNSAYCLLYPSSYEGFGLPPLEAMKAGCPVVAANKSSIPEVVGDAGILANEVTKQEFADALLQLSSSDVRQRLVKKGLNQAAKFSWDKCFEETYAFYENISERS